MGQTCEDKDSITSIENYKNLWFILGRDKKDYKFIVLKIVIK